MSVNIVLVVDDTPVNRIVAASMLELCGFQAHFAENGVQALDALSEKSYAAVLMDCQMPALDGYEATREIRRREQVGRRRVPIIALTANSIKGQRERCLAAGMDDFLTKPLRIAALKDALARAVSGSEGAPAPGAELLHEPAVAELVTLEGNVLAGLLSLYFDEAAGQIRELRDAIRRGDTLTVSRIAHKLSGSSGTLGASHVSHLASELEAIGRTGDLSVADDLLDTLRIGLDQTEKAFHTRAAEPTNDRTTR